MQRIIAIILLGTISSYFLSCNETGRDPGHFDLKKLEGDWLFMHESTREMAIWRTDAHGGLSGTGFVLDENDTTFIEFLEIRKYQNGLIYYASTSRSDTLHRVPYSLSNESNEKLEFINPNYGFPQKVVFDLPNDSTLYFYIEGLQENKMVRVNFIYQKQK